MTKFFKDLSRRLDNNSPALKHMIQRYHKTLYITIASLIAVASLLVSTVVVVINYYEADRIALAASQQETLDKYQTSIQIISELSIKVDTLNKTIDNIVLLEAATKPIKEPTANKDKPFIDRISYLQEKANDKIYLHSNIYFEGHTYITDPRVLPKLTAAMSFIEKKYAIKDNRDAELKIKPVPIELSKAQASLESGKGTSAYYKQYNNPYGLYEVKNKQLVIRRFDNLAQAVEEYTDTLNSYYSMAKFREARNRGASKYDLAKVLSLVYANVPDYHIKLNQLMN